MLKLGSQHHTVKVTGALGSAGFAASFWEQLVKIMLAESAANIPTFSNFFIIILPPYFMKEKE
jgi:hypothetical protein